MTPVSGPAEPARPVRKPVGGYRFISVTQLAMAWFAYRTGLIEFRDLRAYFGLHEMEARRCGVDAEREAVFGLHELRGLVGGAGGERLRASVGRLEASGLVSWSDSKLGFSPAPDAMPGDLAGFWSMLQKITNHRRRVPVPRRTVRLIAQAGRPVVVATIVAYLLRCVYLRDGGVVGEGTCKASWVADVFGVGERNVKAARKFLASLDWLRLEATPQWHQNRYGGRAVVNLAWERPASYADREPGSAPPAAVLPPETAPPYINQKPLRERSLNQKPARAADRPTGFSTGKTAENSPTLRDVQTADLSNTHRLLTLYDQAVAAGHVEGSDYGRLRFVTLAEHALVKGTRNPPGLFMHLLRHKLFHFATNADEDAALERLKRHLHGPAPQRESEKKPTFMPVALSEDAKLAAAVQRVLGQRRIDCDPLLIIQRAQPDWTRARWDRAVVELENARFQSLVRSSGANEDRAADAEDAPWTTF